MKANHSSSRFLKSLAAITIAAATLASSSSAALVQALPTFWSTGINLGAAGWQYLGSPSEWAIFSMNTVSVTATNGAVTVSGDIGQNAGNLSISGNAKLNTRARLRSGGALIRSGLALLDRANAPTPSGGLYGLSPNNVIETPSLATDLLMNQAAPDAFAASTFSSTKPTNTVGAFATGFTLSNTTLNQSTNVSLSAPGSKVVLNLTDFILTGGATFNIAGDESTSLVINVSGTLSLVGGKVTLGTGVLPGNVVFNVIGTGTAVTLTSAAIYNGILLAPGRQANLTTGSLLNGTLIASRVNVSGNSRVLKPVWFSPF